MAFFKSPSVPDKLRPQRKNLAFDLDEILGTAIELKCFAPADAFTADTLGRERRGHGIVIRDDGLILTIGYLIIEAETIWIKTFDARVVQGHALAYDPVTGLGLVQALDVLATPIARLGSSAKTRAGEQMFLIGAGGQSAALETRLVAKQEFAGYWEYIVDRALFVSPAHPDWGGAGLFDDAGALIGVGSLQVEQGRDRNKVNLNMAVPLDGLAENLDHLARHGRLAGPARPWLGVYAVEAGEQIVVAGLAGGGPAEEAGLEAGDIILGVENQKPRSLAELWRRLWALGPPGVVASLIVERDGRIFEVRIQTADRLQFFKAPRIH